MEVAAIRLLIEKHVAIVPRSKSRNLSPKFFQSGNQKKTEINFKKEKLIPLPKARRRRGFLLFLVAKK